MDLSLKKNSYLILSIFFALIGTIYFLVFILFPRLNIDKVILAHLAVTAGFIALSSLCYSLGEKHQSSMFYLLSAFFAIVAVVYFTMTIIIPHTEIDDILVSGFKEFSLAFADLFKDDMTRHVIILVVSYGLSLFFYTLFRRIRSLNVSDLKF